MEQERAPHKVGEVDLRFVITDRPPPVRTDPPSFDPPPVPARFRQQPLSPEAQAWFTEEGSLAPTERLVEPPPRPRTWGHPALWVLAAFLLGAALALSL